VPCDASCKRRADETDWRFHVIEKYIQQGGVRERADMNGPVGVAMDRLPKKFGTRFRLTGSDVPKSPRMT
jgi:hypothetical protein